MDRTLHRRPFASVVLGALVALVLLALSGSPARADTALSTPGTPVADTVTMTSVSLSWTPSTGPVSSYTVQVIDEPLGVFHDLITTTATQYTHGGLTPDTVYEYRVTANPVADSGYTASTASGVLFARTQPVPDSVPPTTPGTPVAFSVGTISATIGLFNSSTDNHRVAGYVVQRQINGVWTDIGTNNITTVYLYGLTPDTTYTVVMVAFDANGNRSPQSPPLTFTTRKTEPVPTCRVQISAYGLQQFLLTTTIENMTAATVVDNWRLAFTMPAAQTVGSVFSMTISRSVDQATGSPVLWNTRINPGSATTVGFLGTRPTDSPLPSGFVLTGTGLTGPVACTG
jgi:chitodextrinase